jgi:hypothetical protein
MRSCARASAFVRSIGKHLRACVCVCVCVCVFVCVFAGVSNDCVCMHRRLCGRCGGTAATVGNKSTAGGAGQPAVRAWLRSGAIGRALRTWAAGKTFIERTLSVETRDRESTWTLVIASRTSNAPWAARSGHTSVVDAAGAIYVIGGRSYSAGPTDRPDVWASTDGGARAGLRQGGVLQG